MIAINFSNRSMKTIAVLATAVYTSCSSVNVNEFFVAPPRNRHLRHFSFKIPERRAIISNYEIYGRACNEKKLRFITFGGSQAIGNNAYTSKLCDHTNKATANSIPSDVASCLKTIIGENKYDVFILDYYSVADKGLDLLVGKIRSRFPRATIIIMEDYFPIRTGFFQSDQVWTNSDQWAQSLGYSHMNDKALIDFSLSDKPWRIEDTQLLEEASSNAIAGIGGWTMYKATNNNTQNLTTPEVKNMLLETAFLYQDWGAYNDIGHQTVANQILNVSLSDDIRRSNITYSWDDEIDPINCSSVLTLK